MQATVEVLAEDRLFALGGSVENDGRITWLPEEPGGWAPLNAYLLKQGTAGLVVDTQMPIAGDALTAQLAEFELDTVDILFTRVIEFDSVGNAELLERQLPLRAVHAHYMPEQWVYWRGDAPPPGQHPFESRLLQKRQQLEVAPGFEVTVMEAPLKLLTAAWAFDHVTGTMFTSDAFSHALAPDATTRVVAADADDFTQPFVQEHLQRKFDWIEGADTAPMRRFLAKTFDEFDIRQIAPTFGCVLSGADVVARHYAMVDEALANLGAATEAVR